jgi:hypothetical protein
MRHKVCHCPSEEVLMISVQLFLSVAALVLASTFLTPRPAHAYQVDCAILLCVAGGFPPSEPCARARAEIIRRITPWPIEPPLQLWRCPMRAELRMSVPQAERVIDTGYVPQHEQNSAETDHRFARFWQAFGENVTDYVMVIKVYDLTYSRRRNRDGDCVVSGSLRVGTYDRNWDFRWGSAGVERSPDWFFQTQYTNCTGVWFRGVGMEWRDFEGETGTYIVRY